MILPTKHINFSQSYLGFGSYLLNKLKEPASIDDLWEIYQKDMADELYFAKHSFDGMILTLIFLYTIGVIKEQKGIIYKCNS